MPDRPEGIIAAAAQRAAAAPHSSVMTPDVDPTARARPAEPGAATPDLGKTEEAMGDHRQRSTAITILALLALLYTLYFARAFLIPIVYAVLLNFLLAPVIRACARLHIRPPYSAAVLVLALLAALGGGTYALSGPAQRWATTAPQTFSRAEEKLRNLIRPVQQVSSQVEQAAGRVGSVANRNPQQVVVTSGPSVSSRIFGTTEKLVAAILEIVILLYFLLAGGDLFLQKLIKVLPHFSDKLKAVEIARATEAAVSAFLTTTLMVNVAEGTLVALALWAIGLPNAPLWGVMVALLEFVPYLGALAAVIILGLAGLTTFDSLGHALLAPAAFLVINLVQANVVSPLLLGHRLTLNPVAIFVGLTFFFWIWGVPGAFLAVPLLATLKIFCDHIESLAAVGEFLGQRDENERRVVVRVDRPAA
ncbi:MAG TPA: AI-2E family transporter [Gemmatimonadaceae bacterium]|nr:AI-2E family transporter [Gemmatimonadaceae bacterium]